MAYPGFPFPTSVRESFIGHKVVLDYLESFAQHNQLHQYIKVCLRLIDVPVNILGKYLHSVVGLPASDHKIYIFDINSWSQLSFNAVGVLTLFDRTACASN